MKYSIIKWLGNSVFDVIDEITFDEALAEAFSFCGADANVIGEDGEDWIEVTDISTADRKCELVGLS